MTNRCCILMLLGLALGGTAEGAEILSIKVENDKGTYTMTSEVWFDATLKQIYEVYRYWDYSTEFSSAIVEARDMEPDQQGRPQFYIRNKGCVLFFCQSFERQGHIELQQHEVIRAYAHPETSDFHFSNESWHFVPRNGGTVVTYDLEMKPKFWVPPGIGPYLIKRKLKNNGGDAVDRIERIAQGLAGE